MFETIVALATPPLKSALAIVRVSGDDSFKIVSKIFSKDLSKTKNKEIHFGYVHDEGKSIDQVVLLTYVHPHSFTGEDSVEIICHGSPLIANQIVSLLIKNGARIAVNGEFSSRAYLNGKIDLVQAEAINDIINATTIEARDFSMISLKGETSKMFKPIKDKIADILSHIEVNIDYPEYEDIEEVTKDEIIGVCGDIVKEIDALIVDGERGKLYKEGLKIAIVGKPNVGKSSLLNSLIKDDKAIVTDIAGTTRDIVEGDFVISGVPCHLFDTAGLRESDDKIEKIGINKSLTAINNADLVLFLVDETGLDQKLYDLVKDKKHIVVTNKADLISAKEKGNIYISAKNNDVDELINKIKDVMNIGELHIKPSFNNTRQLGLLRNVSKMLNEAINDAKAGQPVDLVAVSIMSAYNCALDLTGENNKNDLTDEIFSRFCVGK